MADQFKTGDLVRLKSGSYTMAVNSVDSQKRIASCVMQFTPLDKSLAPTITEHSFSFDVLILQNDK